MRKKWWAIPEKNAELTNGEAGTVTDSQAEGWPGRQNDNSDFLGASTEQGSNKYQFKLRPHNNLILTFN